MEEIGHGVTIRNFLKPGDLGAVIQLHGLLYGQERGFDYTFEAYVAEPIAQFVKEQTDRECIWIAEKDGVVQGSIAIVRVSEVQAQLRWFLLAPSVRGIGLGRQLMQTAMNFCNIKSYTSVKLLTISEQQTAIRLYESFGFRNVHRRETTLWGRVVQEEMYEAQLTKK
ncbi:MAG TPA: GNAT family N-acetyltransferase [Saprospiraceae bacterium]|nr:GNAT family N-acetyltransferase [Saprospiraceae bacterium]HMP23357.1 GNAT family N-acetyltransferase [Saprospiraceae bacterium]